MAVTIHYKNRTTKESTETAPEQDTARTSDPEPNVSREASPPQAAAPSLDIARDPIATMTGVTSGPQLGAITTITENWITSALRQARGRAQDWRQNDGRNLKISAKHRGAPPSTRSEQRLQSSEQAEYDVPRYVSDILERIGADATLTPTQRRDLSSALNRLCQLSTSCADNIPATSSAINPLLADLNPAKCGVSPQTYRNMLSCVRRAFRLYCRPRRSAARRGTPLPECWQELKRQCADKKILIGLHRFIGFCAASGWSPGQISVQHFERFAETVQSELILKDPNRLLLQVAVQWNRATKLVPGWPSCKFPVPEKQQGYTFKWDTFPTSFREDVENWLRASSEPDLMSEQYRRSLKPTTIISRRFKTLQIASALVHKGVPQDAITSLSVLVEAPHAQAAMTFFWERADKKPRDQTSSLAVHLNTIARECCPPNEKVQKSLAIMSRKLANPHHGMRDKNRRRLLPFNDHENVRRLMDLPSRLVKIAANTPKGLQAASLIRTALWIEILIFCPIRASNLARIDLKKHLIRTGRGRTMLVIPASEVKNNAELTFELEPITLRLLDLYLKQHRSAFTVAHTTLLFPARNGSHVCPHLLYESITRVTERYLGHKINPHLFRHLSAMLFLNQRPGEYEVVRRVLAHKRLSTTTNSYVGLEAAAAVRHFDETMRLHRSPARKSGARNPEGRS